MDGFGWALRVRYIMENADDIASVQKFWDATNNTMGLNHGFGSAKDNQFLALETKQGYTAYFLANDPREQNFNVNGTQYGYPLVDALWRTNHGVDPEFLTTALDTTPGTDTQTRYMLIHDTISGYSQAQQLITPYEAVNISAVVGAKGGSHTDDFTSCVGKSSGSNIISAAWQPASHIGYLAFENGHADNHVTACCNYYVKLDFTQWFQ